MTDQKLLNSLSKLGFPMFEPSEEPDANETLAAVVKSNDTRLLEAFPVLLANASESYQFTSELVAKHLNTKEQQVRLHRLMLLSGAVFSLYHLSFSWWNKLKKGFPKEDKTLVKSWKKDLAEDKTIKLNDTAFDPERMKGLFELGLISIPFKICREC